MELSSDTDCFEFVEKLTGYWILDPAFARQCQFKYYYPCGSLRNVTFHVDTCQPVVFSLKIWSPIEIKPVQNSTCLAFPNARGYPNITPACGSRNSNCRLIEGLLGPWANRLPKSSN